jgi:hypothetical protein
VLPKRTFLNVLVNCGIKGQDITNIILDTTNPLSLQVLIGHVLVNRVIILYN